MNDSRGDYLIAYDVQPDGSLANRRNFAKYQSDEEMRKTFPYLADALCVDADGRVYLAMPLGVDVFSPKGDFLGRIPVTKKIQNLAFAGADRRSLYNRVAGKYLEGAHAVPRPGRPGEIASTMCA